MRVAVLMGGPSPEYQVSLDSGVQVCINLDLKKYSVKPVIISKDGKWQIPRGYFSKPIKEADAGDLIKKLDPQTPALPLGRALSRLIAEEVDVAFIIIHGPYGEDGTLQGCLEVAKILYTGSGVLGSALAIDKSKSLEIFSFHKIPIPRFIHITKNELNRNKDGIISTVKNRLGFPVVVKPTCQGSTVGISIVEKESAFFDAISLAFSFGNEILFEEFIKGIELTCGVLESVKEGFTPLLVTEIVPKVSTFFTYEAKYQKGGSEEITPARIDQKTFKLVQELAVKAHQVLRCEGFSRTDFILKNGTPYALETNTLPGMTQTSLLPQGARASGISFTQLLDRIITHAIERKEK